MRTLIIGGAGSGKSAFAETLVCRLEGKRIYLATMSAEDRESLERISRHRSQRSGRGFETMEKAENLADAEIPTGSNILLEDLSNLLANEMFHSHGGGFPAVRTGVEHIASFARHLTIVTNEIFSDGERYEGDTLRYQEQLAELNRELAEKADLVVEVVCGLPNVLKGNLP